MSKRPTQPDGIRDLLDQYDKIRGKIDAAPGEALPALDVDLSTLATQIIPNPEKIPDEGPPFRSPFHQTRFQVRSALQGRSELTYLHGMVVSHLSKSDWPSHAPALFLRLWTEHGALLLEELEHRWLVSAITTFGEHGATAEQRSTGLGLMALFGTIKLYEAERLYSGLGPNQPYALSGHVSLEVPLPSGQYSVLSGGLDVSLIARLWRTAQTDPVIAPLAHQLLRELVQDDRSLFRRLHHMRLHKDLLVALKTPAAKPAPKNTKSEQAPPAPRLQAKVRPDVGPPRWGIVSTIKAPLPHIARFAAHHLELGADALHIYLDTPDPEAEALLTRHPKIHITHCDDAYWQSAGKPRMEQHQRRQTFNATRCLRACAQDLEWLGHVDVDEFILSKTPLTQMFGALDQDVTMVRLDPAESLAPLSGTPNHFKLTHKSAKVKKSIMQDIYPTFGLHLYGGFLSHTAGKAFARTGLPDTLLGIHTVKHNGKHVTQPAKPKDLYVAHMHAPNWEHFLSHLSFRQSLGSYRPRSTRPELGLAEVLKYLSEEEGEDGLRAFFDEVCADTPELRNRLETNNMLLRHDFDFDASVSRVFGSVP